MKEITLGGKIVAGARSEDVPKKESGDAQTNLPNKSQQEQDALQTEKDQVVKEDSNKIEQVRQKLRNMSGGELTSDNQSEPEYSLQIKNFLKNAPEHIKELIENINFYHVTHKNFAERILNEGIKKNSEILSKKDIDFLRAMFDKYGDKESASKDFFEYHILGQQEDADRSIWVNSSAMTENYQLPEKLKFLLQNLNYLAKSNKLSSEEKTACQNMLASCLESLRDSKDGVYVLQIKASSPPVLNALLGNYDLERLSPELIKRILTNYEPNLEVKEDIPARDISVAEKRNFDFESFTKDLENSRFIVFRA